MPSAAGEFNERILDALAEFATALNDVHWAQFGAMVYKRVAQELNAIVRPDDVCKLAFPSFIVMPGVRAECFVAVLGDRVVIAWKTGAFRKAAVSMVIPFATITGVQRQAEPARAGRGPALLSISASPDAAIALPVHNADTAAALICAAIGRVAGQAPASAEGRSAGASRAVRLLAEARRLLESAGPRDSTGKMAAADRAREARRALGDPRDRTDRLLFATAMELSASVEVDFGDVETGIGGLIGAASAYLEIGSEDDVKREVARVDRALSAAYSSMGMRERAAQFAVEYFKETPASERDVFVIGYALSALAAAGKPEDLIQFVGNHSPDDYPEPARSMLAILAQRANHRDYAPAELIGAARQLAQVLPDLRLQCTLFAANALLRKGHAGLAVQMLTELRSGLAAAPMTDARIVQAIGVAAGREGDHDVSLRNFLVAWTRYDDLRYRVGSPTIRGALEGELARSRRGALAAAAGRGDWRQLLELIEASRLQAVFDVPGSIAELDDVLATGTYTPRPSSAGRVVDPGTLPPVFQIAVGDLLDTRAEVTGQVDVCVGGISTLAETRAGDGLTGPRSPLHAEQVMRRHSRSGDLWWSSWHENGVLYWVLASGGVPVDGGALDIAGDEELRYALSVFSLRYGIKPTWRVPATVADVDLTHFLAVADSFEELQLTSVLARVLPPATRVPGDPGRRLIISCAAELAPVPWPILPLDPAASPVTRLIEHFELRFVPSLAVLSQAAGGYATAAPGELPFLLTCDYFPHAGDQNRLPSRPARVILAAKDQCHTPGVREATALNVLRFLRSVPRGTEGVAFFRTHYEWVEADPSASGIALADEVLPSGLLAARNPSTGQTLLSLPSTVVMSCCSTSGMRERNGGETLGLAPLAIMAGARRLIVTSVEIRHTPFTVALDDMLIDVAMRPEDHFTGLRNLQLRLLDEWRRYSLRDVEALRPITPTPDIWAHYQSFGA